MGLVATFEIERVFVFNKEDHYQRILHGIRWPRTRGIYNPEPFRSDERLLSSAKKLDRAWP